MYRIGAWVASCALLVAWSPDIVRAGEPGRPANATSNQESKTWFQRMFSKSEPKAAPVEAPPPAPMPKERPSDAASRMLSQEQSEYLRRLEVITKAREYALQTNDEAALQRAEALEREATEVYQQRIGHLPVARLKPLPEEALDRQLGTGVASNPLQAGTVPGKSASASLGKKGGDR